MGNSRAKDKALREVSGLLAGVNYLNGLEADSQLHDHSEREPQVRDADWRQQRNCLTACFLDRLCTIVTPQTTLDLFKHWIEYHATSSSVPRKDGNGYAWLCPSTACDAYFHSRLDLLDHLPHCTKFCPSSATYWCNQHRRYEKKFSAIDCESTECNAHHNFQRDKQNSPDSETIYYKDHQQWPSTTTNIFDRFRFTADELRHQSENCVEALTVCPADLVLRHTENQFEWSPHFTQPLVQGPCEPEEQFPETLFGSDFAPLETGFWDTNIFGEFPGDIQIGDDVQFQDYLWPTSNSSDDSYPWQIEEFTEEEPAMTPAIPPEESDAFKELLQQPFECQANDKSSPPSAEQWRTLQSLRKSMKRLHSRLICLMGSKDANDKITLRLRKQIVDAADFLNTGILCSRAVLSNKLPTSFKEVIAFVCLSCTMLDILKSKGEASEADNPFSGIDKWRLVIPNRRERKTFDKVVCALWPKAQYHLYKQPTAHTAGYEQPSVATDLSNILQPSTTLRGKENLEAFPVPATLMHSDTGIDHSQDSSSQPRLSQDGMHRPSTQEKPLGSEIHLSTFIQPEYVPSGSQRQEVKQSFQDALVWIFERTSSARAMRFSDFIDYLPPRTSDQTPPLSELGWTTTGLSQRRAGYRTEAPSLFPCRLDPGNVMYEDAVPAASPDPNRDKPVDSGSLWHPSACLLAAIWDTFMFRVVLRCLEYIGTLGDVLTIFGVCARPPSPLVTGSRLSSVPMDHFVDVSTDVSRWSLVNLPLLKGISVPTESLLHAGLFGCLQEVEEYIILLGRYLTSSYYHYLLLVWSTVCSARVVAESVAPDDVCSNCLAHGRGYDLAYRDRRMNEERDWATHHMDKEDDIDDYSESDLSSQTSDMSSSLPARSELGDTPSSTPLTGSFVHKPLTESLQRTVAKMPQKASERGQSSNSGTGLQRIPCGRAGCKSTFTAGRDYESNRKKHMNSKHGGVERACPFECSHIVIGRLDNLRKHCHNKHHGKTLPEWLVAKKSVGGGGVKRKKPD